MPELTGTRFDTAALTPRPVVTSVGELLAGVTQREPLAHTDGKSGAVIERVRIGDEWFVSKVLDVRADWTMRSVGDYGCTTLQLWRHGLLDALPDCINQPIVAVAHDPATGPGGYGTVLLMRDVGRWFVPEGDTPVTEQQHHAFMAHMAALHARFWDFEDRGGPGDPDSAFALGLRVPVGIAFDFNNVPLDIFVQVVPVFDIFFNYGAHSAYLDINASVGIRYWFN